MTAVDSSAPTVAAPSGAPPETSAAIQVRDLWKRYGRVEAVRGLSLDIRPGEIFGLIGPDGAGKTSTFQMLSGVMEPTSGSISVLGHSAQAGRAYVGYLTQAFSLYQDLTVHENLRYIGAMRNLTDAQIDARGLHYLSLFGMERFLSRQAGRLSGGMKQKLALACALVAAPQVLLLDEPTTGVDPVSRREFWDSLADLSAGGMTIVVATPYLDEAERCTRVALMYDGMIHELGTPAELRSALGLKRLEVSTPDLRATERALREAGRPDMSPSSGVTNVEAPLGSPESAPGPAANIVDVQRFGDRLDVMVKDPRAGEQQVRQILQAARISLTSLRIAPPTLENVFVATLRAQHPEEAQSSTQGVEIGARKHAAQPLNGDAAPIAIGARDLVKSFGDFHAVKNIDLGIRYGEIYGLLGANGAGKTTTIKMLCGLLAPTSGEITLAGEAGAARSPAVRQRVGYMSQKFSLYDDLTVEENIDFFSGIYGVAKARRQERKDYVLRMAGLTEKAKMMTRLLAGGWKQRLALGCAILHEPPVLFLDEPTSGVDPIARRSFWELIYQLSEAGQTIFVSTHYMDEAEYCHRLALMYQGRVVALGTPEELKSSLESHHLFEVEPNDLLGAMDALTGVAGLSEVAVFGSGLHVTATSASDGETVIRNTLERAHVGSDGLRRIHPSMEDVFVAVIEEEDRRRKQGAVAK
jgi:ABC-2 type transport system ATP-binding protein